MSDASDPDLNMTIPARAYQDGNMLSGHLRHLNHRPLPLRKASLALDALEYQLGAMAYSIARLGDPQLAAEIRAAREVAELLRQDLEALR